MPKLTSDLLGCRLSLCVHQDIVISHHYHSENICHCFATDCRRYNVF